jgi:hypothetical protein
MDHCGWHVFGDGLFGVALLVKNKICFFIWLFFIYLDLPLASSACRGRHLSCFAKKGNRKKATLAGSATTPAGRKLISLRLLEFAESSTFGNSTAAIGGRPQLRCKTEKIKSNIEL